MKVMLTLAVALVLVPSRAGAQRATSPADAAIFIRLVGSVRAEIEEAGLRRTVDLDHVEIGTGSGFVISPLPSTGTAAFLTDQQSAFARGLLAAWVKKATESCWRLALGAALAWASAAILQGT